MRLPTYILRFALAAVLTTALIGEAAAQTVRVGGIVRDDRGAAIRGATVIAENTNFGVSFSATTDEKGRFSIIGLRPGEWQFRAGAPAHAPQAGEMRVRVGVPNPPILFELKRTGPEARGALAGLAADDLQAELAAADALFNQQKWDAAVEAYRAIMAKAPALTVINLQIAAAYRNLKNYGAAIDAYEALLNVDEDNEKATIGIALTNLERGDSKAAEAVLQTAANDPDSGRDVFFSLGDVKAAAGQAAEAAAWYQKASAADPSWGRPLHRLGMLALQAGDRSAAERYLTQSIAVDPASPEAALARTALEQMKR